MKFFLSQFAAQAAEFYDRTAHPERTALEKSQWAGPRMGSSSEERESHARFGTCLEFGCGVAQVTSWLARMAAWLARIAARVVACAVSAEHLRIAEHYLRTAEITNVDLIHIDSFSKIKRCPACIRSSLLLLLQHNPPPLIAGIVDILLALLDSGGIVYLQGPQSWRFSQTITPA